MRKALLLTFVAAALLSHGAAQAAVPRYMNFQGRLADASGTPLTGTYSITFSIWDASTGGSACHSVAQSVATNSGLFNASIGAISTGCDFSVQYYFGIKIGSDAEMSPRIPMTTAAYSFRAENANNAALLAGYSVGNGSGQVPRSNAVVNTNLYASYASNADTVDGNHASAFATAGHGHSYSHSYTCTPRAAVYNVTGNTTCGNSGEFCASGTSGAPNSGAYDFSLRCDQNCGNDGYGACVRSTSYWRCCKVNNH